MAWRVAAAVAAVLGLPGVALAQPGKPPPVRSRDFSSFEQRAINDALGSRGASVDPAPEGKIIEGIDIVALDVIEPRDPAPMGLNLFHVTSRPYVIEREVLVRAGEPYRKVLVDETSRNLRALPQLSLVACLPVRSATAGKVRLLILTKDVWSLRGGTDIAFTAGGIEKLTLSPTESNVAGLHHTASVRYERFPESFSLGARYAIPRVLGSRIYSSLEWNLIFNQRSGDTEGHFGIFSLGLPLFSSITPWAFSVGGAFRRDITRRYVNARASTFDAVSTPQNDAIPFAYRSLNHAANAVVTRSYGWGLKHDVTLGVEAYYRSFSLPALDGFDPRAVAEFERAVLPQTDHRVGPLIQYNTYTTDFITVLDFDTLGLQEDVRVGHSFSAKAYPVAQAFGSSRDFFGTLVGGGYAWPLKDGFARVSLALTNELEARRVTDASASNNLTVLTPRLGFGRLLLSVTSLRRYRNFRNETSFLGGDTNLRGYPSSFLVGKNSFIYNLELRTRPIEVLTNQIALALFHDVGDAYEDMDSVRLKSGVGVGLRALFPQLSRMILRADLGFPLSQGSGSMPQRVPPVSFFMAFGQAFKSQ